MRRREFIALLGVPTAAWPAFSRAQEGPVLVGFLSSGSSQAYEGLFASFRRGLEVLGYVDGRNIVIDSRWADGRSAQLPALAADLVRRQVKLIAVTGISSALAAKAAQRRYRWSL